MINAPATTQASGTSSQNTYPAIAPPTSAVYSSGALARDDRLAGVAKRCYQDCNRGERGFAAVGPEHH